jgi:signal transduction histidine kinase
LFRDLDDDALETLAGIGHERSVIADVDLFRMGQPGDALYCILEGTVSLRVPDESGQAVEIGVRQPGDTVGELALIDGGPRSATVTTTEPCLLFVLERQAFLKLLGRSPNLVANLLVSLTTKIRNDTVQLFDVLLQHHKIKTQQEIDRRRSLSQVVAGVAHEINTPLGIANHAASVISELASKLGSEVGADAKSESLSDVLEACQLMQKSIQRADRLVRTFKTLSVSQATDEKVTMNLRKLTLEVLELYKLKARASKLTIEVVDELRGHDDRWEGYPGHYSQVLLNLLTNIDRYAYPNGQGGKVEIAIGFHKVANDQGYYEVVVRDFGRGISPEHLEHIFEPFYTTGRAVGGTGLGLAIVKNLITESLHGEIHITSRIGGGTAVSVCLPCVSASQAQPVN